MVVSASITTSSVPSIAARSSSSSAPTALESTVWCGPPAVSHASVEVRRLGRGFQTARATGGLGSGSTGGGTSIFFGARRDPSPLSGQPTTPPRAGRASKTRRPRSSPPPLASGGSSLDGESGQLAQPAEVLEVAGEGGETAPGEEAAQSEFDLSRVAQ